MIKDCHVGIKGIVRMGDSCLVLQNGSGADAYWDVPGGRIDDDEALPETLTRELREELPGIKEFSIGEVVGAYRLPKNIVDNRGLVLIFYKVDAESFDVTLSNEHVGYRWVTKETVSELLDSPFAITPELYSYIRSVLEV
jgi:8-oxo-dGTP pyrophosphatase MutT (NUDIX family)